MRWFLTLPVDQHVLGVVMGEDAVPVSAVPAREVEVVHALEVACDLVVSATAVKAASGPAGWSSRRQNSSRRRRPRLRGDQVGGRIGITAGAGHVNVANAQRISQAQQHRKVPVVPVAAGAARRERVDEIALQRTGTKLVGAVAGTARAPTALNLRSTSTASGSGLAAGAASTSSTC